MKKNLLATVFVWLAAGLFAQPFDGGRMLPPDSARRNDRTTLRPRPYQQGGRDGKTLDSRNPADRLQLQRPIYRPRVEPPKPKETVKPADPSAVKPSDGAKPAATVTLPKGAPWSVLTMVNSSSVEAAR